jgi:hypothetical protein
MWKILRKGTCFELSFTITSWWNGKALFFVTQRIDPTLANSQGTPQVLAEQAMKAAETKGIPQLFSPEDLVNQLVDEHCMVAYLCFFPSLIQGIRKTPVTPLRSRLSKLQRKQSKQKLQEELATAQAKLQDHEVSSILSQMEERHKLEREELQKEVQIKQDQLERERLKWKLEAINEWKVAIHTNGLEASVQDGGKITTRRNHSKQYRWSVMDEATEKCYFG